MMVKALKPKKVIDWKEICASGIIGCIWLIALIFLFVSGIDIAINYYSVLSGTLLSSIAQEQMSYSIQVFVGAGLFLIVYSYDASKAIRQMFHLKDVPPINRSKSK